MNSLSSSAVFFLGIGGIGMSAIARYFLQEGKTVYGYDKTPSALTDKLQQEGAHIVFDDNLQALHPAFLEHPANDVLVVRTPAVPQQSALFQYFEQKDYVMLKRSEVLGLISAHYPTIAVAGTHGKTTTSSLIAHVLQTAGIPFHAFLGGIANNFNSNLITQPQAKWLVVEADEFDRSFLTLSPKHAVVTSVDADHLDIYGDSEHFLDGFKAFVHKLDPKGRLVIHADAYQKLKLNQPAATYCLNCNAMYSAQEIMPSEGMFQFSIVNGPDERQFAISLPGLHNVQNAMAAYLIAKELGIADTVISKAFMSFEGVERRFHNHVRHKSMVYIDDYAHHPTEIDAVRDSLRLMYPERKICAIFQPHLFSRTRDFMDEFARSLSDFDELLLLDIYPARELPIDGISSKTLLKKIKSSGAKLISREEIIPWLQKNETDVVLTIGAGDIDRLVPDIAKCLTQKLQNL